MSKRLIAVLCRVEGIAIHSAKRQGHQVHDGSKHAPLFLWVNLTGGEENGCSKQ